MLKRTLRRNQRMLREGNAAKRLMGRYTAWWGAAVALVSIRLVQVDSDLPLAVAVVLGAVLAAAFVVSGHLSFARDERRPLYLCCLLLWWPVAVGTFWAYFAGAYTVLLAAFQLLAAYNDRIYVRTGASPDRSA